MGKIVLILGVLCCVVRGVAQERGVALGFSEERWDFGTIAEDGGDVAHTFEVTNMTDSPVVILNIRTSCGCTTPEYSTRPIAAGAKVDIRITFDPRYRPGTFAKDVYIYSSGSAEPATLVITGRVTPRKQSVEERFPYKLGGGVRVAAQYLEIELGDKGELALSGVEYINTSSQGVEVEFVARSGGDGVKLLYDSAMAAGEQLRLEVGYVAEKREALRKPLRDSIDIYINGVRDDKVLYIVGRSSEK